MILSLAVRDVRITSKTTTPNFQNPRRRNCFGPLTSVAGSRRGERLSNDS